MRAVVWIAEGSWQACVDRARELLPADAEVSLLHVADVDVEGLVDQPTRGLLGRRRPAASGPTARDIGEAEARSLLEAARRRFGRPAEIVPRRGRVEREVLEASADADVLLLIRDGEPRRGPKSLGREGRFIVDHAGCEVILAWARRPPGPESMPWPPHLR